MEVGESKGVVLWPVVAVEGATAVGSGEVGIEHNVPPHAAVAVVPGPGAQAVAAQGQSQGRQAS